MSGIVSACNTAKASSTVRAKIDTQSRDAAGRNQAGGRDQPRARLQADDVVEARRNAAGARGIGAEREPARCPAATATAEPELEPPGRSRSSQRIARHAG